MVETGVKIVFGIKSIDTTMKTKKYDEISELINEINAI
jgi:hypothetical protein